MKGSFVYYIILEEGAALSKKKYPSWRDIQDEFRDYMSSLGPWSLEELIGYFKDDFGKQEEWPFSEKEMKDFLDSDKTILVMKVPQ